MRKTSHDGLDSTSITSGLENEIKKSGTTGIIKIKKSSIKRKVPNFSHESDDGIVEPLLQTDREKTEITSRSAKYLLTKTKTDSISENEDSIKMSDINMTNFSTTTPITTTNKTFTSNNSNMNKDSNFISNITEVAPIHNHMNTNVFSGPDVSKAVMSTKSPILVELDVGKTSGYNPSLIFTTAKIHTDCKTKLMEPVQVTPVPIISTIEKSIGLPMNLSDTENKKNDMGGKHNDIVNNISEKLNKNDKQLSIDKKITPETNIRNNATSKNILNLTEITTSSEKNMHSIQKYSVTKSLVENNEPKKIDKQNANITTSLSNETNILKDSIVLQGKKGQVVPDTSKCQENKAIEQSSSVDKSFKDNTIKIDKDQPINDKFDKKNSVQGSKKLQRQKKATVEEGQESTPGANIVKDKLNSETKKTSIATQSKPSVHTNAIPSSSSVIVTTSSTSIQASSLTNINVKCIPQPVVSSKIPSPVVSQPKVSESKIQLSTSKITTTTFSSNKVTSASNTTTSLSSSLIPTSINRTTQGTEAIKPTTLSKTQEKQDTTIMNKSPQSTKPGKKDITPGTTDKSSPVSKTLPPYIVSTSKTKIGIPVVTGTTLKSEPVKSTSESKNVPSTKYLVNTTPSSSIRTTSTTVPVTTSSPGMKQSVPVKQIKSKTDKQNEDNRA